MKKRKSVLLGALVIALAVLLLFPTVVFATSSDDGWDDEWGDDGRPHRVEPEGEGTVYEVCFIWEKDVLYEPMAVLEGEGLGPRQWLEEWHRTDYTFMGWYDNVEGNGERYTMYTPIYQDTYLYALWKYAGLGGPWPRPTPSGISGLEVNENLQPGATATITAAGYNTHLIDPPSERFRWIPVSWRVDGLGQGQFSDEAPYTANISMATAGSYTLCITYREEVFDSITWQDTGKVHEAAELSFSVGFEHAATNNLPASSRQAPQTEVEIERPPEASEVSSTGPLPAASEPDEETASGSLFVPIIVGVAVLLAASGGVLLYARRKCRKNEDEHSPHETDPWDEDGE